MSSCALTVLLVSYFMFVSDQWAAAHLPFFSLIILRLQTNLNHFWPPVCDGIPSLSTKTNSGLVVSGGCSVQYTAKNQYRQFETNIPRKGTARPQSSPNFHSCVCERYMYSHDRSAYSSCRKYVDCGPILGIYNRSKTHECGNWDWGRATPRKGIHKSW